MIAQLIMSQAVHMKQCNKCKESKPLSEYERLYTTNLKKSQYRGSCNSCRATYRRELAEKSRRSVIAAVEWAKRNPDRRRKIALNYYYSLQHEAIMAYGGYVCRWCGIDEPMVLCIDHVDNNGREHRRQLGSLGGHKFYKWLRDNGYPEGFQVLCMNCNHGKYRNKGVLIASLNGRCRGHPERE